VPCPNARLDHKWYETNLSTKKLAVAGTYIGQFARHQESRKTVWPNLRPFSPLQEPFFPRAQLATAAAWSPDPKNPSLYLDLPSKDGQPQPDVLAKWAANAPLAFIDQSIGNLRSYRVIAMDVGDQDGLRVDSGKLHDALDRYGIVNALDVYAGTPSSKVADRFQNHVMPFFNQNLCFQASCQ
jgi:hypothetical protein